LANHFTFLLYQNICRSLFEKDKLLFAFVLASKLQLDKCVIALDELRFLLTGGVFMGENALPNPDPSWLTDAKWSEMCSLGGMANSHWRGFPIHVRAHVNEWKQIYDSADPAAQSLPGDWDRSLSSFQKMCVLRTVRMDKIIPAMTQYVSESMGSR
jgi:dynein heavy chain, axonemal